MTKHWFLLWISLAGGLCLIPSAWLTDLEGALVPATKGSSKAALLWREAREPLAHGLLMMGVGYSLMRLLSARLAISKVEGCSGECDATLAPISTLVDRSPSQVSEEKRLCSADTIISRGSKETILKSSRQCKTSRRSRQRGRIQTLLRYLTRSRLLKLFFIRVLLCLLHLLFSH